MTDINKISSIYFAGIGGIGMSALARCFNMRGVKVSGYDKSETALTKKLVEEGIKIHYDDNVNLLDKKCRRCSLHTRSSINTQRIKLL